MASENNNWFSFSSSSMEIPSRFVSDQSLSPEPALIHHHLQPPSSSQPQLEDFCSNEIYQSPGDDVVFLGETTSSFFEEYSASLSGLFQDENPSLDDIQPSAPSPAAVGVAGGSHNSLPEGSSGAVNAVSAAFHPDTTTQQGLRFRPPVQFNDADLSIIVADHVRPGGVRGNALAAVIPSGEPSDRRPGSSSDSGPKKSIYRGVSRHRLTGRYEAYLWDTAGKREGSSRRGRQVYLGAHDQEEKAARAYDLAALKFWGSSAPLNFPISNYAKELEDMKNMSMEELIVAIRRTSKGFSRGASMYRGVTKHHKAGHWQSRIGHVGGKKELYLGTFSSEVEAAEAYDIAAIRFRGRNTTTNFEVNRYNVEAIENTILPVGQNNKRLRLAREEIAKMKLPQPPTLTLEYRDQAQVGAHDQCLLEYVVDS